MQVFLTGERLGPIEVHAFLDHVSAVKLQSSNGDSPQALRQQRGLEITGHLEIWDRESSLHIWVESEKNCVLSKTFSSFLCCFSDLPTCAGRNEEECLKSETQGTGSTSQHHFIFFGRLFGIIWDLSLLFPVHNPCSGRGVEILNSGKSSKFLLAWISLPAAIWNSTSHGHLPGLSETDSCQIPLPCSSISNHSWYTWFWLDETAVVAVGSPSESLGKLPKSCGLTILMDFTLQLLFQLYSLSLPWASFYMPS